MFNRIDDAQLIIDLCMLTSRFDKIAVQTKDPVARECYLELQHIIGYIKDDIQNRELNITDEEILGAMSNGC